MALLACLAIAELKGTLEHAREGEQAVFSLDEVSFDNILSQGVCILPSLFGLLATWLDTQQWWWTVCSPVELSHLDIVSAKQWHLQSDCQSVTCTKTLQAQI